MLLGSNAARAQQSPTPQLLVFEHVTVVDVERGKLLPDQRVVIAGHRIQSIGGAGAGKSPNGAQVVDARGRYLIPGLWDLHVHPTVWMFEAVAGDSQFYVHEAKAVYRQLIANGVTGIRDAGASASLATLGIWKREIAAGQRVGPRLIVSGPSINHPGYAQPRQPFMAYATEPAQAEPLVDSLKVAGADMIKIREMPQSLWFAFAAAARRAGLPFGGHFNTQIDSLPVDGLVASDSGARILDHQLWADVCGEGKDSVLSLTRCSAAAARLRRNHTWVTLPGWGVLNAAPDSFVQRAMRYSPSVSSLVHDHFDWRPLTAAERRRLPTGADWTTVLMAASATAGGDAAYTGRACQRARLWYAANVPWAPGRDFPMDEWIAQSVHRVLLAPVYCGVPAWWALRAGTLEPARAMGLEDSLGTVAPGKLADLVLLDGDPLADIWNVSKIAAVVANGRYFDRAALDRLLLEAVGEWRIARTVQQAAEVRESTKKAQAGTRQP